MEHDSVSRSYGLVFDLISERVDRITRNIGKINNPLKRRRGIRNPSSLHNDDYSLEALLATEFPENISIGELANRIVTALGERNGKFLRRLVPKVFLRKDVFKF